MATDFITDVTDGWQPNVRDVTDGFLAGEKVWLATQCTGCNGWVFGG